MITQSVKPEESDLRVFPDRISESKRGLLDLQGCSLATQLLVQLFSCSTLPAFSRAGTLLSLDSCCRYSD